MRVAIVSPNPESNGGGVERFCHALAEALGGLGHSAEVTGWPVSEPRRFDVVVTNGMIGGRIDRTVPRLHVFHGCWVEHMRASYSPSPWAVRFALQGVIREVRAGSGALRVAVSESAAREVGRWYRQRVHYVVTNAVDTSRFKTMERSDARAQVDLPEGRRYALFLGRAEHRKRPDLALSASRHAGFELLHAGAGEIEGARQFGVVSPDALVPLLNAVDCVIAPSEYEACSFALLEALACGTPVVTTRVGWVPELLRSVPSYRQLTAERGDVRGLGAAMTRVREGADVHDAQALVREHLNLSEWAKTWDALIAITAERRRV